MFDRLAKSETNADWTKWELAHFEALVALDFLNEIRMKMPFDSLPS